MGAGDALKPAAGALRFRVSPLVRAIGVVAFVVLGMHVAVLGGEFHDDDFHHLFDLRSMPLSRFLFTPVSGHVMTASLSVFAALDAAFGADAGPHFVIALAVHLVNTALVVALVHELSGNALAAGVAGLLWGICPSQRGTLDWVIAHGVVFGTAWLLAALLVLARAARRPSFGALSAVGASVFALLAAASHGVAAAPVIALPAYAWLVAPRAWRLRAALALCPAAAATAVAYALVAHTGLTYHAARALRLFVDLVALGITSPVAAGFVLGTNELTGWVERLHTDLELLSLAIAAAVIIAGSLVARRFPGRGRAMLAFAVLALASYASIAAARSGFISGGAESRYHYLQTALLCISLGLALDGPSAPALRRPSLLATGTCIVLLQVTLAAVAVRRDAILATSAWVRGYSTALDAAVTGHAVARSGQALYLENEDFLPAALYLAITGDPTRFPGIGAYWFIQHGAGPVEGAALHFVERDPAKLRTLRRLDSSEGGFFIARPPLGATVVPLREGAPPEIRALLDSADPAVLSALRRGKP